MKRYFILLLLACTVGFTAYSCGGNDAQAKTETVAADPGAQLFSDNCAVCHGENGKAGMSGASDLSVSALTHENTVAVITSGRNTMRPFGSQFTKEEIEAIAQHVESLRK